MPTHDCERRSGGQDPWPGRSAGADRVPELGGEPASAERSARRLVAADPLAERGYLLLMRALDARGDRAAAMAVFAQLRRVLREELGVSPGRDASDLHYFLLRGTALRQGK